MGPEADDPLVNRCAARAFLTFGLYRPVSEAGRIDCPALLVEGTHDQIAPGSAVKAAAARLSDVKWDKTSAPPVLDRPQDSGDYDAVVEPEDRVGDTPPHEALATFLQEGAWEAGFNEWRDQTYMTEDEFQLVQERGLIDEFDFHWNVATEDVGYRAPAVSDDFSGSDNTLERGEIQGIKEELDELGRTVSEVLETDYIHRSGEEFGFFGDY